MAENDVVARARKALAEYDLAEQRVQSMIDAWEMSGWRLDSGMRGDPTPIHEAQTAIAFQLARDFTPDLVRSLLSEVERLRAENAQLRPAVCDDEWDALVKSCYEESDHDAE